MLSFHLGALFTIIGMWPINKTCLLSLANLLQENDLRVIVLRTVFALNALISFAAAVSSVVIVIWRAVHIVLKVVGLACVFVLMFLPKSRISLKWCSEDVLSSWVDPVLHRGQRVLSLSKTLHHLPNLCSTQEVEDYWIRCFAQGHNTMQCSWARLLSTGST